MSSIRPRRWLALWTVLLLSLAATANAQTGAASITGLVLDETGGALPGVTITATNQATNVTYVGVTNEAGNYTITSVPLGTYVIKAELTGFRTAATASVRLEAKQVARFDFKMAVGQIQETVVVEGVSPILQTETATVGEVITAETVTALPLNGRNSSQLSLLMTGALTPNPGSFNSARNSGGGGRPYVNGHREQTNSYLLDGVDMTETVDNRVAYQPNPDALAEISVETNNYAADVGNVAGAVISSILKTGTNRFRGNAFEFYRNSDFDANRWENNRAGAAKPERTQHIFGGTFGGPIVKNKLFFFANYQNTVLSEPGTQLASVAPAEWRAGDLSGVTSVIRDPLTGQPFPGNIIPANRISAVARAILSDTKNYPLPNRAPSSGLVSNNYVGQTATETRAPQGDVRVDYNPSNNDRFFGRLSIAEFTSTGTTRAIPLFFGGLTEAPFRNYAFNWNHIFGSTLVNEALVGYNKINNITSLTDWAGVGNANATYGIPGGQPIAGLSAINMGSGLSSIGSAATLEDNLPTVFQIQDKLTWTKGRQLLKFGGQWLRYNQQRYYAGNNGALGTFTYSATFTGFAFADFLLDLVQSKGRGGGDPDNPWTHKQNRISLYVQDDIKVTPNLTVNAGLRWAYTSPLVEKNNRQANFNLQTGAQVIAKDGSIEDRALYRPYYNGWEPRIGASYRFGERWVFRAAYGISQFMEGTGSNLRLPMNPPFFFESNVIYDTTSGAGSAASGFSGLVPGTTPSGNVRAWNPELRPQFTHQWNVFAEYLLTSSTSVNVGYVGHDANNLVVAYEGNQPLPGVGDPSTWAPLGTRRPLIGPLPLVTTIATTGSLAYSDYQSLQASVRQRNMHGLELLASYTLAEAKSNSIGFYGSGGVNTQGAYWQNAYDPDDGYGPSFFDARHNFTVAASYELPFGRGKHWGSDWSGVMDAILGGWTLSGIFQGRSGFPVTVTDSRGSSLQAVRGNERPNCVGDWKPSNQSIDNWIDINAFQRAAPGTWGNCRVGSVRAPGYTNIDMTLGKRFSAGGDRYFEFKLEAFNVLNQVAYGPPARNFGDPNTFGKVTSTIGNPRIVELGLKFYF
jgi:hypothetical protein